MSIKLIVRYDDKSSTKGRGAERVLKTKTQHDPVPDHYVIHYAHRAVYSVISWIRGRYHDVILGLKALREDLWELHMSRLRLALLL